MTFQNLKIFSFLVLMLIAGCASKQQVQIEKLGIDVPDTWTIPFPNSEKVAGEWWSVFSDSTFNSYLARLQTETPDVKTLIQNQRKALYNAKISGASIYPSFNFFTRADTNVQNLAGFGFADSFLNTTSDSTSPNEGQSSDAVISFENRNYGLGVNLQWEIDVWGRLLNGRRAAYKNFEAIEYDLSYLEFSTLIKGAKLYFNGKEAAAQLRLANESYQSLVEIRDLVKERYEKGLRSSLDYRLSETSVATSLVSIENRKNLLKSINRQIEILLGEYPSGQFIKNPYLPTELPLIPKQIPASVLQRRPDIQSLILKMEASGYRVAQSKRNLLPGISLNGTIGTSTQEIEKILDKEYGIWNLGLNLTAPLLNGGRLKSAVNIEKSNYEISKQNLVKGILNAFYEVEQFLELGKSLDIQIEALDIALKQSKDAYNLSKERYDKGITTLESVLNSQRQYNSIQAQYLSLKRQAIENRLSLILAMGGKMNFESGKKLN